MKEELIELIVEADEFNNVELNVKAKKIARCEDAITKVKVHERLTKSQEKNIICLAYRQGLILNKVKESDKF